MFFLTTSIIFAVITILITYFYITFKKTYRLFNKIGIPHLKPTFPLGNVQDSVFKQKHFGFITQDFYNELKKTGEYGGVYLFNKPALLVTGPEFAKTLLVRDFANFVDRGVYYNKETDPLSANLFFIEGDEWRSLRAKITPTFTSGKMKMMFHTILNVADELVRYLNEMPEMNTINGNNNNQSINLREYLARFTTDVIGSCAFGLDCNSIVNPHSEFREMGKKMFNFTQIQSLKLFLSMLMRKQARALGVQFNSNEVIDFVMQLVRKTIAYRKENNVKRNDFMQLMIDLYRSDEGKNQTNDGQLSFDEIAAQSFVFFFAGFETSSTTMTYALYELAINQNVQTKLRQEILSVNLKKDERFTYENIMSMTYLDQVISETLRKYPPVATLHRVANNDYHLPCGAVIQKGMFIIIPTYGFHHDPDNFPQPGKFDPNRFTDENKLTRHPYSYLPFGEGPRICIGMRFGVLQSKIGLAMLVKNFQFDLCDETEVPMKIDQINLLFVPLNGLWLKIKKL